MKLDNLEKLVSFIWFALAVPKPQIMLVILFSQIIGDVCIGKPFFFQNLNYLHIFARTDTVYPRNSQLLLTKYKKLDKHGAMSSRIF